jgi:hypothetical protein
MNESSAAPASLRKDRGDAGKPDSGTDDVETIELALDVHDTADPSTCSRTARFASIPR